MRDVRLAAVTCIVGLTAAGCAGGVRHGVEASHVTRCAPGSTQRVGTRATSLAAVAVRPLHAYAKPGLRPFARFELLNVNRVPTVFSVLERRLDARCRPTWLHVELPVRP